MRISILVDDISSWFVPYAIDLSEILLKKGHAVTFVHNASELPGGDICFLLSCVKLVNKFTLVKYCHNIVIHASDLPKGKGFTPLKWQVLNGENDIVITLFEAAEAVDAGRYYFKDNIHFEGHELLDEMQDIMAKKIIEMALRYCDEMNTVTGIDQEGVESFYPKRTKADDEIDIHKSIVEQFNHFRIADNKRFPLWFSYMGHKYSIKVEKYRDE
ncbi:MAG: hypothetical protein IKE95_06565 [Methanobrevibacter sp.]|nr:hypothetical protein [Methanobrevibacter sp.]